MVKTTSLIKERALSDDTEELITSHSILLLYLDTWKLIITYTSHVLGRLSVTILNFSVEDTWIGFKTLQILIWISDRFFQQIIQKDVVHNMDTYITREIKAFNLTAFPLSQLRNAVNTARHSCWLVSAHTGLRIYFIFLRKNFLNRSVSKTHWMDEVLIRLAIDRKFCDKIALRLLINRSKVTSKCG